MPTHPRPRVLIVDDDPDFCDDLETLIGSHFEMERCSSGEQASVIVPKTGPDVILLDVDLGDGLNGVETLEILRSNDRCPPVIMITGDRDMETVVRSVRSGAFHYIGKPPDPVELRNLIERAISERNLRKKIESLQRELDRDASQLIAESGLMKSLVAELDRAAETEATILLTGESGTGKEVFARRLHERSLRREGPFIPLNCAAVSETLIESELFGHEKGGFTDAQSQRLGVFDLAHGGTLFLDEIGDASLQFQVKLLRVLEDPSFRRVGGDKTIKADVRLVAATSRNLETEMAKGNFRKELFYRLNLVHLQLPPLRQRPEDIMPMAFAFLARAAESYHKPSTTISESARTWLEIQDWSGNVRELKNAVERAVIRSTGEELGLGDFLLSSGRDLQLPHLNYDDAKTIAMRDFKIRYLTMQLDAAGGSVPKAAERSGLLRQSFGRMLKEVDLSGEDHE